MLAATAALEPTFVPKPTSVNQPAPAAPCPKPTDGFIFLSLDAINVATEERQQIEIRPQLLANGDITPVMVKVHVPLFPGGVNVEAVLAPQQGMGAGEHLLPFSWTRRSGWSEIGPSFLARVGQGM